MYQVIARKYRPQRFDEVVSQDHVKRTIANAIDQRRIGHGYIFSGPRGTGKTTMARILAMSLNCTGGPKSDFDPDDPVCKEIAAGAAMDVIEIDAASNRRIDDIRELRENVRYRPARDRYKVFIIDEAHQITTDAFNALLKTLEEPPEWAVFVLCTTEPQAIPATIHSRCQSFHFRTVDMEQVIGRMRWICEQEGIEADDDALTAIALAGDGSIRDSLSTLDQAIASCGNKLTANEVRDLLGAIPAEVMDRIVETLAAGDAPGMLAIVDGLFRDGRHPQHFVGELTRYFRNLMVMKVAGADTRLVTAGSGERKRAAQAIERFTSEDLTRYVQLLLNLYRDLHEAGQPRFHLEIGMLKLVYAGKLKPIEEALAGMAGNGSAPARSSGAPPVTPPASGGSRAAQAEPPPPAEPALLDDYLNGHDAPPAKAPPPPTPPPAPKPRPSAAPATGDLQARAVAALREGAHDFLASTVQHCVLEESDNEVVVRVTAEDRTTLEFDWKPVEEALRKAAGRPVRVILGSDLAETEVVRNVAAAPADEPSPAENEAAQRALEDPDVKTFQQLFPGQVREVRNLREFS
jgi:DNA polymerase-3 subunit gamma/tau